MTKSELIEILATKSNGLSSIDATLAVNCLLEHMASVLEQGKRIEIRGFGSFSLRHFAARRGRNPKTGETVEVSARSAVHFKPGLEMRERADNMTSRIIDA